MDTKKTSVMMKLDHEFRKNTLLCVYHKVFMHPDPFWTSPVMEVQMSLYNMLIRPFKSRLHDTSHL